MCNYANVSPSLSEHLSCVINTSAIPVGRSSDLTARRNALSHGSESASDAAADGDLQGAGQAG